VRDLLRRVQRRTLRDETDAGAEADARGERRGEGYRDERLDEPDLAGEREAAVGGVWVARGGRVEERHVLGEPERMKTGSLGDGRRGGNQVAEPRWIAGQREEESELHGGDPAPDAVPQARACGAGARPICSVLPSGVRSTWRAAPTYAHWAARPAGPSA